MYLLDTNVISELRRVRPHGAVLAWLRAVDDAALHISAVTLGEIQSGIERTRETDPDKAAEIEDWLDQVATVICILVVITTFIVYQVWREWTLMKLTK